MSHATIDAATVAAAMERRGHADAKKAAPYVGIPYSTLWRAMQRNSGLRLDTACKIADYCGCGLDDLVRWPE